uniref:Cytochrome P450 n=2 Tax=Denticeps clupeoides TaxID=299321 RepID=A0AAY4DFR2_9TELE
MFFRRPETRNTSTEPCMVDRNRRKTHSCRNITKKSTELHCNKRLGKCRFCFFIDNVRYIFNMTTSAFFCIDECCKTCGHPCLIRKQKAPPPPPTAPPSVFLGTAGSNCNWHSFYILCAACVSSTIPAMILYSLFEWIDVRSCLVFLSVFFLISDIIKNKKTPNFPPGPWPLPFLGNMFTGVDFKTMDKLAEKYGEVFSLRWGSEKTVFVSGYKMVKEALVTQLDSFPDRPVIPLFHVNFKGQGIISSNGYLWKMQRKFIHTHLTHFAEGKKTLELSIQQESHYLCEAIKEENGKPFDPQFLLNNAVGNVICSTVFGHRFEYNDERFLNVLRLDAEAVVLSGSARAQLFNAFPSLFKYLPGPHQTIHSNYAKIVAFLREEIDKHRESWDPSNPQDYVDSFLGEIEKNNGDTAAGFHIENLVICTLDIIEAGMESTATTLRWALFFMMMYPDIQEKVQAEIDSVIGQSRQPNLADRPSMPYTDAVIHETQRLGNIVPLGFPKVASKDTTLAGYFIPKGTVVTTILSSVLKDKNEWETPEIFNPGHFLDAQGKFRRRDAFLPFSAGKRMCVGEQLARMELFLMFTSLLQRFSFSPAPGQKMSLEGVNGFTYSPHPYNMCAQSR